MSRRYPCIYCTEDLHCTKYSDDDCESWCVLGPCTAETPSNGDKIRRMTDEELAEFFVWMCPPGKNEILSCEPQKELCHQCWLDWLRQEAQP